MGFELSFGEKKNGWLVGEGMERRERDDYEVGKVCKMQKEE